MKYWEIDIEKVNEFNFFNKEVVEVRAGGVKAWLM